jgi:hypothetical protein
MSSPSPVTGATPAPVTTPPAAPPRVRHEHDHEHSHGRGVRRQLMSAAAEALGMERKELRAALRDGKTLAQIAEDKGMTAAELKTKITEKVTAAATPEAAERALARLDDFMAGKRIDSGHHRGRDHDHHRGHGKVGEALKTFADSLGMTTEAVVAALKEGKSIKDLVAQLPAGTTPAPAPTTPGLVVDTAA